jgi:cytochrome c-type biogenesis protein CcmE|tara:strand:+ start:367 stop:783 length:417 start_codon:yes stop_codon:yes gene_type:complete
MLAKKAKKRLIIVSLLSAAFIIGTIISTIILKDNILFFLSPSEVKNNNEINFSDKIRIGGMVKKGSVEIDRQEIKFIITDLKNEIVVSYSGPVPNLFAEGKGVIAEGILKDKKFFIAQNILAKHDENYMPPNMKKSMK